MASKPKVTRFTHTRSKSGTVKVVQTKAKPSLLGKIVNKIVK